MKSSRSDLLRTHIQVGWGKKDRCAMQQLKERGVYTLLSEGKEFVAHAVFRGVYTLYTPKNWEFFGPYTYESDWAGNIRREGQTTRWHIDDLAFTNRIARSRSHTGAALSASDS